MRGVMLMVGGWFDIVGLRMWLNGRRVGVLQRTESA